MFIDLLVVTPTKEGGGGVSGNADVSISFFEKKNCVRETKNIEKSLKKPKSVKKYLKFPICFRFFFLNSTTVLSSDKIQTGEI